MKGINKWWQRKLTDNFTPVHLRARTLQFTHNMGHTRLVAHGRSQVNRLLGVILRRNQVSPTPHTQLDSRSYLGERLDLSTVARSALSGQETQRAMTGCLVLYHPIRMSNESPEPGQDETVISVALFSAQKGLDEPYGETSFLEEGKRWCVSVRSPEANFDEESGWMRVELTRTKVEA
jgi:hypothetical protein